MGRKRGDYEMLKEMGRFFPEADDRTHVMTDPNEADPGADDLRAYAALQKSLLRLYRRVAPDPAAPRTAIVLPSLSLEDELFVRIDSVRHYEERLLSLLELLHRPRSRVIFLSSLPVDPLAVDYHLELLHDVPRTEARRRLELFHCDDARAYVPLTRKILARPDLLRRLRGAIGDPRRAYLTCYTVTHLERRLALELDVPVYGCDPELSDLGSKSGSREIFAAAGLPLVPGHERLRDAADIVDALTDLERRHPGLRRAVVKLEHGSAGEGNALFDFTGAPEGPGLRFWIARELPRRLECSVEKEDWESFEAAFEEEGGVVEAFVEGEAKRSPSVQCQIDPAGVVEILSTHDQLLGGKGGQVFEGCVFPADAVYRQALQAAGRQVAGVLAERGVIGPFAVDFISVWRGETFEHRALEINLRKGGTTHPRLMLELLTGGTFDAETGLYRTPEGALRYYRSADGLLRPAYRRLHGREIIERAVDRHLHFDRETGEGVVFEPLGALEELGKLGLIAVAGDPARARRLFRRTVRELDRLAARRR